MHLILAVQALNIDINNLFFSHCLHVLLFDENDDNSKEDKPKKYRIRGIDIKILNERVQYYDKDGKLITESITDYSKKNILGEYATLDEFINIWNSEQKKQVIIDELSLQTPLKSIIVKYSFP